MRLVLLARATPLQLAARRLWQRALPDKHHVVHPHALRVGHRGPYRAHHRVIGRWPMVPNDFCDDDDMLAAQHPGAECGYRTHSHGCMRVLRRGLDVLRIEVAATDDDEILQAPGDHQIFMMECAEIAGAQVRCAAARQAGAEQYGGLLFAPPVARGHAPAGNPDFSHDARGTLDTRFGMHHAHIH